jgi:hypothetical protein
MTIWLGLLGDIFWVVTPFGCYRSTDVSEVLVSSTRAMVEAVISCEISVNFYQRARYNNLEEVIFI